MQNVLRIMGAISSSFVLVSTAAALIVFLHTAIPVFLPLAALLPVGGSLISFGSGLLYMTASGSSSRTRRRKTLFVRCEGSWQACASRCQGCT
mmetsp:Transcript_8568/g.21638  ORF Transcript_8568/g.21638 Transcript_8568/m.21638 type:complete len:93 (-) Transcript_8568:137-415(-)